MRNRDQYQDNEAYNRTSNTAAGINTPLDHQDTSPLDMISHAIEEIVDNVQHAFDGADNNDEQRYSSHSDGHSF
ncbi:hypothetical protein [Paenibacillus sp. CF384]|uniref:hypothetical protein n=1 Tax=Paenibacillus sp. CF384 TaxID=1884382 RepID=UPI00089D2BB1|nr:hypothetical protein [Paenibacillus sp. CF384]SDW65065.1 hypothetical protein SAMN05518855_10042 [Paenibacillus sp. CF384]